MHTPALLAATGGFSLGTACGVGLLLLLQRRRRRRFGGPARFVDQPHPGWQPGQPQPPPYGANAAMIALDPATVDKASMYAFIISAVVVRRGHPPWFGHTSPMLLLSPPPLPLLLLLLLQLPLLLLPPLRQKGGRRPNAATLKTHPHTAVCRDSTAAWATRPSRPPPLFRRLSRAPSRSCRASAAAAALTCPHTATST
jgi:hypothetical protein